DNYSQGAFTFSARNALGTGGIISGNIFNLLNYSTSVFSIDHTGKVLANSLRVSNLAGVSDTIVLSGAAGDVYNSTFKTSDFALAGSLGNYLPLSGGTVSGSINFSTSFALQYLGNNKLIFETLNTRLGGNAATNSTTDGLFLRPAGAQNAANQVLISGDGFIR